MEATNPNFIRYQIEEQIHLASGDFASHCELLSLTVDFLHTKQKQPKNLREQVEEQIHIGAPGFASHRDTLALISDYLNGNECGCHRRLLARANFYSLSDETMSTTTTCRPMKCQRCKRFACQHCVLVCHCGETCCSRCRKGCDDLERNSRWQPCKACGGSVCPMCATNKCVDCELFFCAGFECCCGEKICTKCKSRCGHCREMSCERCTRECMECGEEFCRYCFDAYGSCDICHHSELCGVCLPVCHVCSSNISRCKEHLLSCEICLEVMCEDCSRNAVFCVSCVKDEQEAEASEPSDEASELVENLKTKSTKRQKLQ